jgi:hypothetical protein
MVPVNDLGLQPSPNSRYLNPERRVSPRTGCRLRVLLREDRFATSGYTVNISHHGALLQTSAPLRIGALYDFYLEAAGKLQRISARAVRELPGYIYAVQFESEVKQHILTGAAAG